MLIIDTKLSVLRVSSKLEYPRRKKRS